MPAVTLQTMVPIITATVLSFFFKSTRPIAIAGVAVLSYFFPIQFLVMGSMVAIIYGCHKFQKEKRGQVFV